MRQFPTLILVVSLLVGCGDAQDTAPKSYDEYSPFEIDESRFSEDCRISELVVLEEDEVRYNQVDVVGFDLSSTHPCTEKPERCGEQPTLYSEMFEGFRVQLENVDRFEDTTFSLFRLDHDGSEVELDSRSVAAELVAELDGRPETDIFWFTKSEGKDWSPGTFGVNIDGAGEFDVVLSAAKTNRFIDAECLNP